MHFFFDLVFFISLNKNPDVEWRGFSLSPVLPQAKETKEKNKQVDYVKLKCFAQQIKLYTK